MRTVAATRYVTPLREGGSLPAIVEADDSGMYVLKFRGAGQGVHALVAELICGELARALELPVPELVLVSLDAALGRNEPDAEIRELLKKSAGLNLALDYLPRSITFDPVVGPAPSAELASRIVWFDAFVTNVDRTPKNPNLLVWHRKLYLIDHGAALYFHFSDTPPADAAKSLFAQVKSHVLLPFASDLQAADRFCRGKLSKDVFARVLAEVPDGWTVGRAVYQEFFERRLEAANIFLEEAERARSRLL
ncbi:MAG TPA: HipA family kinase [Myxococcaceae bacterium]|jgi:hypothetical protein